MFVKPPAGTISEHYSASESGPRSVGSKLSRRRDEIDTDPTHEEFRDRFIRLLRKAPDGVVRDYLVAECLATRPPWIQTDMQLERDDQVTVMAVGRVCPSLMTDVRTRPCFQLWMRAGSTEKIFLSTRNTFSFVAPESGRLHLAIGSHGGWPERAEDPAAAVENCNRVAEILSIVAIRWGVSSLRGLRHLANAGDICGLVRTEIDRLCKLDELPQG